MVEDDVFDLAVEILLSDDYLRQCFCPPLPEHPPKNSPVYHFGFYQRGEAHFFDRDASMPPVQLWRRSKWFPGIDILEPGITEMWFPFREQQELRMHVENEPYLLHGISCYRPRPFRIFTEAQLVESALFHGAACLASGDFKGIGWGRTLPDAMLYMGTPELRGKFHHPAIAKLYAGWLVKAPRAGSSFYFRAVLQALSEHDSAASADEQVRS